MHSKATCRSPLPHPCLKFHANTPGDTLPSVPSPPLGAGAGGSTAGEGDAAGGSAAGEGEGAGEGEATGEGDGDGEGGGWGASSGAGASAGGLLLGCGEGLGSGEGLGCGLGGWGLSCCSSGGEGLTSIDCAWVGLGSGLGDAPSASWIASVLSGWGGGWGGAPTCCASSGFRNLMPGSTADCAWRGEERRQGSGVGCAFACLGSRCSVEWLAQCGGICAASGLPAKQHPRQPAQCSTSHAPGPGLSRPARSARQ